MPIIPLLIEGYSYVSGLLSTMGPFFH